MIDFEELVSSPKEDTQGMKVVASLLHKMITEGLCEDMQSDNPKLTDKVMREYFELTCIDSDFFKVLFELSKKISNSEMNPFSFDKDSLKILGVLSLYMEGKFEVFGDE